jgi:hypothetical protein
MRIIQAMSAARSSRPPAPPWRPIILVSLALTLTSACISVRPVIVAEKTPLENEILGEFERLQGELALPRPGRGPGDAKLSAAERQMLQGLLDRQANAAEIAPLRKKRVLIELRTGLLGIDRAAAQREDEPAASLAPLVTRENKARKAIMDGLIALSPKLGDADLPAVRALFYRLHSAEQSAAP